ncbi:pentapeptide repeat-containing protein [Nostoc sp. FACHB-152]|uniref:pentapeptide repeat-containing protein n=1 Tax=Nostoc sp. FACHB-145 TaxID=2692836 RepID=UPI001685606E|nr:pentapeptide repeat-containing protein [Nostoc sp. FACHB-145]MBD2445841.1 pentapeptide repeat-containing protein [Nostoc sp. FACHB-152]MBD2467983.1 pentapeptide repeat-containing protein [Nostoc sp. FACHB-145]
MLTHLLNAYNIAKKHSNDKIIFKKIFPGIGYISDKKQRLELTKRLSIASAYLEHQIIDERVIGIYKLEQIIQEYPQYQQEVVKLLTAFVRQNAPHIAQKEVKSMPSSKIDPDIQAVLSMIRKLDTQKCLENEQIDLSYTDLQGANLSAANLAASNLYQVNLSGANLSGANLSGAILSAANLVGANLSGANLSGAILSAANLSEANLSKANLIRANLYLANLQQANLQEANFEQANLREAKFSG